MPTIPQGELPKAKSWDEFEDIVWDLFALDWQDPHAVRNGRSGQRQNGVDIYGQPAGLGGRYVGIQCKRAEDGRLTRRMLEKEIAEADKFRPPLAEYIIATTESLDAALQEAVRTIDEEHRATGKFRVRGMTEMACSW